MNGLPAGNAVSLNGWTADLTFRLARRLGLAARTSGGYGGAAVITGSFGLVPVAPGSTTVTVPTVTVGITRVAVVKHLLVAGPEFRLWQKRRLSVGVMAGIGAARFTPDSPVFLFVSLGEPSPTLQARAGFAGCGAASVDITLSDRVSYRLLQPGWLVVQAGNGWKHSIQLATGLVIRLTR